MVDISAMLSCYFLNLETRWRRVEVGGEEGGRDRDSLRCSNPAEMPGRWRARARARGSASFKEGREEVGGATARVRRVHKSGQQYANELRNSKLIQRNMLMSISCRWKIRLPSFPFVNFGSICKFGSCLVFLSLSLSLSSEYANELHSSQTKTMCFDLFGLKMEAMRVSSDCLDEGQQHTHTHTHTHRVGV